MSESIRLEARGVDASEAKPKWHAPVLTEELIGTITGHRFSANIDNYERTNPVAYGS